MDIYLASNGKCVNCGASLDITNWHADHIKPYVRGGMTEATNGQALCPTCNRKKGSKDVKRLGENN